MFWLPRNLGPKGRREGREVKRREGREAMRREGREESVEGVITQNYIILVESELDGCPRWRSVRRDVVYVGSDGSSR
jgi:hypothetical protein